MSDPIRISVSGRGIDTDAPSVQDLLHQVGDCFGILVGVEEALAGDGIREIEWRVTDAGRASPLALELSPFPLRHGMHIDRRVRLVREHTARGLDQLRRCAERPSHFTDQVLERAERLFQRVTDGLGFTKIEYGEGLQDLVVDPTEARAAAANALGARRPGDKPYREIGSVEGSLQRVERDGYGRPILYVKLRLDGEVVKCIVRGDAQAEVERHEIAEIWQNHRVRVFGTIHYKAIGRINQVEADAVQFLRSRTDLPSADDIIDRDFTAGMRSEDYLERLRNGELS